MFHSVHRSCRGVETLRPLVARYIHNAVGVIRKSHRFSAASATSCSFSSFSSLRHFSRNVCCRSHRRCFGAVESYCGEVVSLVVFLPTGLCCVPTCCCPCLLSACSVALANFLLTVYSGVETREGRRKKSCRPYLGYPSSSCGIGDQIGLSLRSCSSSIS